MSESSQIVRVFFAVELPDTVKSFLKRVVQELKQCGGDVKWTNPAGMHLTLKFIGEITADRLTQIEQVARPVCRGQTASVHRVSQIGVFPDFRRPRVIWAGCSDESSNLSNLANRLEDALEPLGFAKEKRAFKPHLTLGRLRSNKGLGNLVEGIRDRMDVAGPSFTSDHAILFRSVLKPSGAEYSELFRFDFTMNK